MNQTVPLVSISTKVMAIVLHRAEHLSERDTMFSSKPFPYRYIFLTLSIDTGATIAAVQIHYETGFKKKTNRK